MSARLDGEQDISRGTGTYDSPTELATRGPATLRNERIAEEEAATEDVASPTTVTDVQIPGLGMVVEDVDLGWYYSAPIPVAVLDGTACRFVLDGYDNDPVQEDFHAAIRTFRALDRSAMDAATSSIFAYYRDVMDQILTDGDGQWYLEVDGPHEVLDHVRLGNEPTVSRDPYGDRHVYISVECECDWEPEHGLQIVFRDGATVTKVGPYDGHLTSSAAWCTGLAEEGHGPRYNRQPQPAYAPRPADEEGGLPRHRTVRGRSAYLTLSSPLPCGGF